MTRPKIVLTIMARNEAPIIGRALASALPHVDAAFLSDTGSTDGTIEVFRKACREAGVDHFVDRVVWQSFATNRNSLSEVAWIKYHDHYQLLLDADDELTGFPSDFEGGAAGYRAEVTFGNMRYPMIRLIDPTKWYWSGVTHEALLPIGHSGEAPILPGFSQLTGFDSDRRRSGRKDLEDYGLLAREVEENTQRPDPRSVFYLAQTAALLGRLDEACLWYDYRRRLEGFDEERFMSAYRSGKIRWDLARVTSSPMRLIHQAWADMLSARDMRPHRPEPYVCLAQWSFEGQGNRPQAIQWADQGLALGPHTDRLFCESDYAERLAVIRQRLIDSTG